MQKNFFLHHYLSYNLFTTAAQQKFHNFHHKQSHFMNNRIGKMPFRVFDQ